MKRKKLLEFADWLERSRKTFDISDGRHCVSMQACRFNGDVKHGLIMLDPNECGGRLCSDAPDLMRIFDVSHAQAHKLYSGFEWSRAGEITRKVAAAVVRGLARTGKVHWGQFAELKTRGY